MKKRRKGNVEFVTDLMEFSRHGALVQAFVISALSEFSKRVVLAGPAHDTGMFIVNPEAWFGVAKEIQEKLDAQYGSAT